MQNQGFQAHGDRNISLHLGTKKKIRKNMYWEKFDLEQKGCRTKRTSQNSFFFFLFLSILNYLSDFMAFFQNIRNFFGKLGLKACLAMCLIFQVNRGWLGFKRVSYKKVYLLLFMSISLSPIHIAICRDLRQTLPVGKRREQQSRTAKNRLASEVKGLSKLGMSQGV